MVEADQPHSLLIGAIGSPWEIFRVTLGPEENNRVVDLYTKGGNFLGHGANLVLIPDFDVIFVVTMAGRRGRVLFEISGIIVDYLLAALEEAARIEANEAYPSTYHATNGVNSSLSLSTTCGPPGLVHGKLDQQLHRYEKRCFWVATKLSTASQQRQK